MKKLGALVMSSTLMTVSLVLLVSAGGADGQSAGKSPDPTVTSVVPDHGSVDGGTTVDIRGKNLLTATAVSFGSAAAQTFTFKSDNTIQAISPAGSAGPVDIRVTTPEGVSTITSADVFTYVDTPAIQNLSPKSGASAGGTKVTIIGSDFLGVSTVEFGSTAGTDVTVVSAQVVTVLSPAEPVGTVAVTLSGTGGTSPVDPADQYKFVLHVPHVKSLTPPGGAQGTPVTISGLGFTKATAVDFGPNPAEPFTVVNSRTITTTAPAGSGTVDVTVTTAKGTSSINPPGDSFTYPPAT